jgi:DNA-binding transcriptional regulator YiaG
MPKDLEEPLLNKTNFDYSKQVGITNWVVYSDRDNNPTYNDAAITSGVKKMVNFMDRFYVIEDKGEFLHLVWYDYKMLDNSKSQGVLNREAIDMGWAKKSQLLIWNSAMYNDKMIKIKALPAIKDAEVITNPETYIKKGGNIMLYNSPDTARQNEQQVNMFQFLYVYKKIKNKYLVGKTDKINSNTAQMNVLGWVDERIVQIWSDRVCLEPNWYPNAVNERKSAGIKATLLLNDNAASNYNKNGRMQDKVWDDDPYTVRKPSQYNRFPILGIKDNIIETGVLGDIVNKKGQSVIDLDAQAAANRTYNEKVAELRQVNLIFVIDGGEGMSEYMPSLMEVVRSIKSQNYNNDVQTEINYGAVMYRDYGDESCGGEDLSATKSNLSKSINDIIDFISTESKRSSCNDKDPTQAVRKGVYKALQMLSSNDKREESNFIILIGARGDKNNSEKDNPYRPENLSNMIADVNAHFIVFQMNNGKERVFSDFVTQGRQLFTSSIINMKNKIEKDIKEGKYSGTFPQPNPNWLDVASDKNIYRTEYPKTTQTLGTIIFPGRGEVMKTNILELEMNTMLDSIFIIIEKKIQGLSASFDGIGKKNNVELDPSILILFHSLAGKIPNNVLKEYSNNNYQFFINAYTTIECEKLKNPVFNRVLFINQDEFDALHQILKNLDIDEGDDDLKRTKLEEAFKQILVTYLGEKEAKKAINQMTADQLMELVTGLRSKNPLLSKIKIGDIRKKEKVSSKEISELLEHFINSREKFSKVRNDPNYFFERFSMSFYWIPEDLLP